MTTTYLSRPVQNQLARAQRDIDRHVGTGPTGRCVACDRPQPCHVLDAAQAVFARYRRLPARRPGRTLHAIPTNTGCGETARPAYDWFGRSPLRSRRNAA